MVPLSMISDPDFNVTTFLKSNIGKKIYLSFLKEKLFQ